MSPMDERRPQLSERLRAGRTALWWFVVRIIQRLLVSSRGEVTALEQAIQLQERLVILALVVISVVPALGLLGYTAFTTPTTVSFETESKQRAEEAVGKLYEDAVQPRFEEFEARVQQRFEQKQSVLVRPEQLHPQVLVALQFDDQGQLVAPFVAPPENEIQDIGVLLDGPYALIREASRDGEDPLSLVPLYGQVARTGTTRLARGLAALGGARALVRAGRTDEALAAFDEVVAQHGDVRDPWGFHISDLARLEAAALRVQQNTAAGQSEVRALVEDLLAETWVVGEGGESAIARRALALMTDPWAADARSRVIERTRLLYWAERLLPEARESVGGPEGPRGAGGDLRWVMGPHALWAIRSDGQTRTAFAFDYNAIREDLNDRARGSLDRDGALTAWFIGPGETDEDPPEEVLASRALTWVPGGTLVIKKGPSYLAESEARTRQLWLRNGAVLLAFSTLLLGVIFGIRLVNREMDLAQMKTTFAANVSHELRSPLTQIRLKGEALMLGLAETPEEQQEYYRAIVRESERLGRLVDDVLDYAVLPSGRRNLAPRIRVGSLVDTVHRALDAIRSSEELRRMDLDVDLPMDLPVVAHDPDAVVRCVINLVSNAAKYSKDSNWIGVRARKVDGALEVSISDRGIGIHPNDLDRIFDPYFRAPDPRVGTKKGAGLGLTMTNDIMKAHGGKVLVQSRQGKGSTFTLRFPLGQDGVRSRASTQSSR